MSPRLVTLAASVVWRHVASDPVRSLVLAWRALPGPVRPALRVSGRYGRAITRWGAGERDEALRALEPSPRHLAAFALAVDSPEVARGALARLPSAAPGRSRLAARLARSEGRLADAVDELDGARSRRDRLLRQALAAELAALTPGRPSVTDLKQMKRSGDAGRPGTEPRRQAGRDGRNGRSRDRSPAGKPVPGRVLHVVTNALPHKHAGYTVRTHQIARAQRSAGLDPQVVTRCGFPVAQGFPDSRRLVTVDDVPYHRLLPYALPRLADQALDQGLEQALRLVDRLRPAVVHAASNHVNGQLALGLREATGLPVVYEVRGFLEETWLSRLGGGADSDLYRRSRELETYCMREADLVVTLGEVMRDEIAARGIDAEKVIVVPNAVADEFLQPLPDPGPLRSALGISPGEPVIGEVTSLFGYEGVDTLLRAAAELRRRGVPVRPLIVGDGPERASLERLAGQLGLAEAAIFTGRVPMADVRRYHALLDVFVVPRTDDRVCQLVTPLKPVEAMASGLCVVASEVGGLREIVKHWTTGALTLPQNHMPLADCLERLLYSPHIRQELGANAREWVSRDRTWARNAQRYRSAYAALGAT
jgi:glycosyltransferase involved in cell wall biosynthesis